MTAREPDGWPFDLTGRVAVVTGAAGGIGLAAASVLAKAGARVILADRRYEVVEQCAAELARDGLACSSAHLDVSDQSDVDALIGEVARRAGRLDVMVNSAEIIDDSSPMTVTEEILDRVHALNFKGIVFGSQAAARVMTAAGRGSIINTTSGVVDLATPAAAAYSTSKAAAAQYSRGLAMELRTSGVRVNTLAPGWTDAPVHESDVGGPLDQAYAILYLASDASRFVTGSVMRVNGGSSMPW